MWIAVFKDGSMLDTYQEDAMLARDYVNDYLHEEEGMLQGDYEHDLYELEWR